ncbi:MAG TPA: PHP domain-containing protein, partial [Solirubrobacteraceae bacterium]|nr:PHP domain-containing protein [Solirubrobacteraceae bacterium]
MALAFDLQSHSTHSDGALGATEVVARAAAAGVELLALSDHDTVSGVSEAVAAGERLGVRVLPAVEISSIDSPASQGAPGAARELHILGYLLDHLDPAFASTLADFLADRERRTLRMADALREQGLALDDA